MAVLTAILSNDKDALGRYRRIMEHAESRVLPSPLRGKGHVDLSEDDAVLVAVHGRRDNVLSHGSSRLAGIVANASTGDRSGKWWEPGSPAPDGSFALVRADGNTLEAATDFAGSRALWHAKLSCGGVVVSTCLELVIAVLGEFTLDPRALGWFLSTGASGPRRSWHKKVKPLPRDTYLRAVSSAGNVSIRTARFDRAPETLEARNAGMLADDLRQAIGEFDYGDGPWLLALSGGFDSRALLNGTRHIEDLRCVTWVDEAATNGAESDVTIARQLAAETGREHEVRTIRRPARAAELERAMRRFVRYSDGRSENVLAYIDGMAIWDDISSTPPGGLLRGDELFGSSIALSESRIRHNMHLDSFQDFASSRARRELAARYGHKIPSSLERRKDEPIAHWRLRLRADHEIPTVYAALNNLRSRFIESCCPLLHRRLVMIAASIEGRDLDERAMYTQAVASMYPDTPVATRRSTLDLDTFLGFPQIAELLREHLETDFARDVLGARCVRISTNSVREREALAATLDGASGDARVRGRSVPLWLRRIKRRMDPRLPLDMTVVAMRSYLAQLAIEELQGAAAMRSASNMESAADLGDGSEENEERAIA